MNDSYNNSFFTRVRQTVYKWWCVVYKPAYKLFHHGYWPQEKEPYYSASAAKAETGEPAAAETTQTDEARALAEKMAQQIQAGRQRNIDDLVHSSDNASTEDNASAAPAEPEAAVQTTPETEPEADLSNVDNDTLSKANEIMARLAREAAEDEAKKQAEIDAAKRESAEQERLASILKATKPDISMYIEEGKARQNEHREEQSS